MNCIFRIQIGLNKYKWTIPLIALYIIAIPFQRIVRFDIIEYKIQITEIIFLMISLSFLFATKIKDVLKFSENTNRIDISILIWLAVGIINLLIHQNISTFIELIGQCYLITLYFILRIILTTLENVGNIMSFYVQSFTLMGIAIFAVVVIGIVFYLFGNDIGVFWKFKDYPYFGTLYRLKAFTNEPVMLTSILSTIFICYVGSKMENNKTVLNKRELLLIIIIGLMLLFTFSKSLSCLFIVLIVSNKRCHRTPP